VNAVRIAGIVAVVSAAALAAWARAVMPPRRSIAQVRAALYGTGVGASHAGATGNPTAGAAGPIGSGRWPFSTISCGPVGAHIMTRWGNGLELAGLTTVDVVTRVLVATAAGTGMVVLSASALAALGAVAPSPLWLIAALIVGAASGWMMWSDAGSRVVRRRQELSRAVNDFVQLVAVGLTTDQSVDQAIQFALSVGDSTMFARLRRELATAPLRGIPVWEALEQLGDRYDQRELRDLGGSIERQGTQGVSITTTVATMAAAMRARSLDELERDADRANANLSGPTVCFVVTTVVFLAYPLALRISEAFGG
jgi:hypothetical protein